MNASIKKQRHNGNDAVMIERASTLPAAEVRRNFSYIVKRVQYKGDIVGIAHHGTEVASIVSKNDALFLRWIIKKYGREKVTKFQNWLAGQENPSAVEFHDLEKFFN